MKKQSLNQFDEYHVVLRDKDENGHRNCISSLLLYYSNYEANRMTLFSAGRDRLIISWDVNLSNSAKNYRILSNYDEHSDWVNQIIRVKKNELFASFSNDQTVKVWPLRLFSEKTEVARNIRSIVTLKLHQDYVKCGDSDTCGRIFSGSLDGALCVTDLNAVKGYLYLNSEAGLHRCPLKAENSIYSLSVSEFGNLVVLGLSNHNIRVMDLRTKHEGLIMQGHEDIIKSIHINKDGRICLSGSSDNTVKLWDVGMRRFIQTYTHHNAPVWSMKPFHNFTKFISASKDGEIHITSLLKNENVLIGKVEGELLDVKLGKQKLDIWYSTSNSNCIFYKSIYSSQSNSNDTQAKVNSLINLGKQSQAIKDSDQLIGTRIKDMVLVGLPRVIEFQLHINKRVVIARLSDESVEIWDCIKCSLMKRIKDKSFQDVVASLSTVDAKGNAIWLKVDIKLGVLNISINDHEGFTASGAYDNAIDMFLNNKERATQGPAKIVYGEELIKNTLAVFIKERYNFEIDYLNEVLGEKYSNEMKLLRDEFDNSKKIEELSNMFFTIYDKGEPTIQNYTHDYDYAKKIFSKIAKWVLARVYISQFHTQTYLVNCQLISEDKKGDDGAKYTAEAPNEVRIKDVIGKMVKEQKIMLKALPQNEFPFDIDCMGTKVHPNASLDIIKKVFWKVKEPIVIFYRKKQGA